jgi:hypothetical protein
MIIRQHINIVNTEFADCFGQLQRRLALPGVQLMRQAVKTASD